jgi:hypothetical protein
VFEEDIEIEIEDMVVILAYLSGKYSKTYRARQAIPIAYLHLIISLRKPTIN